MHVMLSTSGNNKKKNIKKNTSKLKQDLSGHLYWHQEQLLEIEVLHPLVL